MDFTEELREIEAIKRLKYRYWRHLDMKQWDELATCFITDASVSYGGGKYAFHGVDSIMNFLRTSLGSVNFADYLRRIAPGAK